jgi:hypothetical protein
VEPEETHHYARSVFTRLRKERIIDPATGLPDKTRIEGRELVHKIAVIPVPKLRELVNFLFWWEGEVQRWKEMENEEEELARTTANAVSALDPQQRDDGIALVVATRERESRMPSSRIEGEVWACEPCMCHSKARRVKRCVPTQTIGRRAPRHSTSGCGATIGLATCR